MRKFFSFFAIAIVLCSMILFVGCSGNNDDNNAQLLEFSGLSLDNATYTYDGEEKELNVKGDLPKNAIVTYENNKATEVGTYNAKAKVSCDGYKTIEFSAILKIEEAEINVSFENAAFTYDGEEKEINVKGDLPENAIVTYENNKATDAGTYEAKVVINCENYKKYEATAKYTINKAKMSGLTFEDETFTYDGSGKQLKIEGAPDGSTIQYYYNNNLIDVLYDVGEYSIKAVVKNKNYEDATFTATLTIKGIVDTFKDLAKDVLTKLVVTPDVWSFLPKSFTIEERAKGYVEGLSFENDFVNVSTIPTNGIGKQLNVMYNALAEMQIATKYISYVQNAVGAIQDLYQEYINKDSSKRAQFETNISSPINMSIKILLSDDNYKLLANVSGVAVELYYDGTSDECSGRIQITDSVAVKYTFSDKKISLSVKAADLFATKIEFDKTSGSTIGYISEYYGTETKNIKNTAVINVGNNYTSIISNKRETDDLSITGYVELYDNVTGNMIASEVQETVSSKAYDTYWFNLCDISNINTIKVLDKQNYMNADTIYINGSTDSIHSKNMSLLDASRRFDIEMKDVYFYKYDSESESYKKIKVSIPMLFVQKSKIDDFSNNFYDENKESGMVAKPVINVSSTKLASLNAIYTNLQEMFNTLKEKVTYSEIKDFVGDKDSFFK